MTGPPVRDGRRLDPATGNAPRRLVVMLHGYGSNGADLIGFAPHLRHALPDTLFLAPNASEHCPHSPGGYQWWGLNDLSPQALAAGARRAAPALDAYIDRHLAELGLAEDQVALVGFSQGTMMALHVGARRAHPISGILGYSGMLADDGGFAAEVRSKPPVLLIHGSADPIVPVRAMQDTRNALHRLGFDVAAHISPGLGHGVDGLGLDLGVRFLAKVLGRDANEELRPAT